METSSSFDMHKGVNIFLPLVVRELSSLPYVMHLSQPQKVFQNLDGVILALVENNTIFIKLGVC